jgi:hypothetical protein
MIPEAETRRLLIASCHSSVEAQQRLVSELQSLEFVSQLVKIAIDADDHQGDAPMQAAYYLSLASPDFTKQHEEALIGLLITANGYAGHVALVLVLMQSRGAKLEIRRMLAEWWKPPQAYTEAVAAYAKV